MLVSQLFCVATGPGGEVGHHTVNCDVLAFRIYLLWNKGFEGELCPMFAGMYTVCLTSRERKELC